MELQYNPRIMYMVPFVVVRYWLILPIFFRVASLRGFLQSYDCLGASEASLRNMDEIDLCKFTSQSTKHK